MMAHSSVGGIFTDDALELLPADWYFMIANAPESGDVSFTWELFATQTNKDPADVLGNFVNRVLTFSAKKFGNQIKTDPDTAALTLRTSANLIYLFALISEPLIRVHCANGAVRENH